MRRCRQLMGLFSVFMVQPNRFLSNGLQRTLVISRKNLPGRRIPQLHRLCCSKLESSSKDWRSHPKLNPEIRFQSWTVSGSSVQSILCDPSLQPYLATQSETARHLHQRIQLVQSASDASKKNILVCSDAPALDDLPEEARNVLRHHSVSSGPVVPMSFTYDQFTANFLLHHLLPPETHPPPTAFETIGHVAHLNLRAPHEPYKEVIGEVLLETLPTIETVIDKLGDVAGPYRTYEFGVIAGKNDTAVQVRENGVLLSFDIAKVYWSSRLSEERQRLIREEFKKGQVIADAFCGVGCMLLQAARQRNCTIWANDWNPDAIEALKKSAIRNDVASYFTRIENGDAYDFLVDCGLSKSGSKRQLPDHVVLNYPLESIRFLGALRWWAPAPLSGRRKLHSRESKAATVSKSPRVHVYMFARAEGTKSAEEVAVEMVAAGLLALAPLQASLDDTYGCNVKTHHVRDVAPGKLVICVSFSATPKLLRAMQGEF